MIIKYSESDLANLNFQYVVQVDNHCDTKFIFAENQNVGFWIEKRIKIIIANNNTYGLFGVYYDSFGGCADASELVDWLNRSDGRYFRPLTKREAIWLTDWLIERNQGA